jgi:pimeloyl-ACP methyl ester carboxylesterase
MIRVSIFRPQALRLPLAGLLVWSMATAGPASAQPSSKWTPFLGEWSGVAARRPDAGLPVGVRLTVRPAGDSVRVSIGLPESRQVDLAVPSPYSDSATMSLTGGVLRAELTPDIGYAFIGNLGVPRAEERITLAVRRQGDALTGELRITTYRSPVTLVRAGPRPREPTIAFHSSGDSLRLGGMLVLPEGQGPFPAMVWVTGSDPDTRLAWSYEARALAAKGIASLLYDKRGVGESSGASHDLASWDDLAGDVEGALAYLRSRPDLIDTTRLGLAGQSQGTWIIAKVAARDPGVRFLVSMAGSGIGAAEQETYRTGALMRRAGFAEAEIARAQDFQRRKFAVARTGLGWAALDSTMQRLRADSVAWFPGYGTGAGARTLASLRMYGVLQFNYEPTRDLARIKTPVLILMGERDLVFPPAIVVERMRSALARAGNRDVTARIIPGASHGLMALQSADGRRFRGAISEEFLATLTEWIVSRVARR